MINGVLVPNLTIFKVDGEVDYLKTKEHMQWMVNKGIQGFFLTGSYGSGPLLSLEEKLKIYDVASELKNDFKQLQLIANIGGLDLKSAIFLANESEERGIINIASTIPLYYNYYEEEIVEYFSELVKNCKCNVFIYNNSSTTNYKLSKNMLRKLYECGVRGIKDSNLDIDLLNEAKELKDFEYVLGTSKNWPIMSELGVQAMIAGVCNYLPELALKMYTAKGNECLRYAQLIDDFYNDFSELNKIRLSYYLLCARGFEDIYLRLPMKNANISSRREELEQKFERLLYLCNEES